MRVHSLVAILQRYVAEGRGNLDVVVCSSAQDFMFDIKASDIRVAHDNFDPRKMVVVLPYEEY